MSEAPKLAEVKKLDFSSASVVDVLEAMLAQAKAGELRAVALVFECPNGTGDWRAAMGPFTSPIYMVGRLHALATQITLNEVLEYEPGA